VNPPSVSVCFPAYNEEATVGDVLREAHELLAGSGIDYEILVCDDGSRDRTRAIIEDLVARIPRLRVLAHPRNLGIRATFEHLYAEATKDFVFLNSTDRQWKTALLLQMLPLTSDWDIVVASRRRKPYGIARHVVSSRYGPG
jgi:glycosyltransferase involved in cell wall biosynthesis